MANSSGDGSPFQIPGLIDLQPIGQGASGIVYRGVQVELNRPVAVKVLLRRSDPEDHERRFQRESEITANLGSHPHIVQVLGTGQTTNDLSYVVMELYEHGSVADRLRSQGPFSVAETLDIGIKIADAVVAAHHAGVIHRDIKPQNILLSDYGPALSDFGIARRVRDLEWSSSVDQLTPLYAAPETLVGDTPSFKVDIWSLGATLYTMLAGRPPFGGIPNQPFLQLQNRVLHDAVPHLERDDVPVAFWSAIKKSMEKSPRDRFESADSLRQALIDVQQSDDRIMSGIPSAFLSSDASADLETTLLRGKGVDPAGPAHKSGALSEMSSVGAMSESPVTKADVDGTEAENVDDGENTRPRVAALPNESEPDGEAAQTGGRRKPLLVLMGVILLTALALSLWLVLGGTPPERLDHTQHGDVSAFASKATSQQGPATVSTTSSSTTLMTVSGGVDPPSKSSPGLSEGHASNASTGSGSSTPTTSDVGSTKAPASLSQTSGTGAAATTTTAAPPPATTTTLPPVAEIQWYPTGECIPPGNSPPCYVTISVSRFAPNTEVDVTCFTDTGVVGSPIALTTDSSGAANVNTQDLHSSGCYLGTGSEPAEANESFYVGAVQDQDQSGSHPSAKSNTLTVMT